MTKKHCCICGGEPQPGCNLFVESCSYCRKDLPPGHSLNFVKFFAQIENRWYDSEGCCKNCAIKLESKLSAALREFNAG